MSFTSHKSVAMEVSRDNVLVEFVLRKVGDFDY